MSRVEIDFATDPHQLLVDIRDALQSIAQSLVKLAETPKPEVAEAPPASRLMLTRVNPDKIIQAIKVVREFAGLSLKDAKTVVDRVRYEGESVDLAREGFILPPPAEFLAEYGNALLREGHTTVLG
jgi:hypothetical protein